MYDTLYFGSVYCPYAKSGDLDSRYWERDVITMKGLGFNVIRPFVAWDRIEQVEGVRDYSALDAIFGLAQKHGLQVLLNIGGTLTAFGGMYHPQWLIHDHNVQQLVTTPGATAQHGPMRALCPDDPFYHRKSLEFLEATAARYAEHPALMGWNLWNEPFFKGDGCHCPLTLARFHQWLQAKYGSLTELNNAWSGEFPIAYRCWEDVEPGGDTNFSGGGYVPRMDWLEFNRQRVFDWVEDARQCVAKHNPRKLPVTVNVAVTAAFDSAPQHNYPSLFDQNRNMDIPGFSAYTFFGEMEECGWLGAMMCSWTRSSGQTPSHGFWAIESEGGQMDYLPKNHIRAERGWRIASNWQMVLHGAKMLMFWKFGGRVSQTQTTGFNICGWDGSVTERATLLAEFGRHFRALEGRLADKGVPARVAILVSRATEIAAIADKSHKDYMAALHGAFKLMNHLRVECDFIDDEWVKRGRLANYRLLLAPRTTFLASELAGSLRQFLRQGGCIVADRFFGMKDESSCHFQHTPGFGLLEDFGCYMNDDNVADFPEYVQADGLPDLEITDLFHSHLHLEGAEEVARFSAGGSAIARRTLPGGGVAWLCGFEPFGIYRKPGELSPFLRGLFRQILASAGITPRLHVAGDDSCQVESGTLTDETGDSLYFLINFSTEAKQLSLTLDDQGKFSDLLGSGQKLTGGQAGPLVLPPYGTVILGR